MVVPRKFNGSRHGAPATRARSGRGAAHLQPGAASAALHPTTIEYPPAFAQAGSRLRTGIALAGIDHDRTTHRSCPTTPTANEEFSTPA